MLYYRHHILLIIIFCSTGTLAQKSRWYVPDFKTLQVGGSIGYISVGAGHSIMKEKARVSLHYGMMPSDKGGQFHIATGKFFYSPIQWKVGNHVQINPIDVGAFISYHFGSEFNTRWPRQRYPRGYYSWSTAWRFHAGIENSVTLLPNRSIFRSVTVYSEFNTNELYAVSYILNTESLTLREVIKLGVGVRFSLRK